MTLAVSTFHFETTDSISEAEYLAREGVGKTRSARATTYLVSFTVLGALALFSRLTAPIGGVTLAICAAAWTAPRWMRWGARKNYRLAPYLAGPLTYGISDEKLWFRGGALYSESTWEGLAIWGERDGILSLSAHGMPLLRFHIDELRSAGLYDSVASLMRKHAVELDSPEARRMVT